jgi:hypothetical protein
MVIFLGSSASDGVSASFGPHPATIASAAMTKVIDKSFFMMFEA